MEFEHTEILGVLVIKPEVFSDERGFFMETFRSDVLAAHGINLPFVQDNHSSSRRGVLRGLHYQIHQTQGKVVQTVIGEIFDVVVDLRRSSPTFGRWKGVVLSAENNEQLWIPPGLAHGMYVLSDRADVIYKATDYYAPAWERTLLWNDPAIGIDWPLINGEPPVLSQKDVRGKLLSATEVFD